MPLYFFQLRDGQDILLDPEGCDLKGLPEIVARALHTARSILSAEAMEGKFPLNLRIDVENAARTIVHTLRFEDAIEVTAPDD
jgi:hypothetical protein